MSKSSRRKFINISATSLALSLLPNSLNASTKEVKWNGTALGVDSSITLYHKDKTFIHKVLNKCLDEIKRLENIFSIYNKNSAISKLNKKGILKNPPKELVEVLNFTNYISNKSNGAFDITVQPLWNIYTLYSHKPEILEKKISKVKKLINYKNININKNEISFKQKGMSITLNGIAQGYITDKISDLLKSNGFTNVLVDLGEISAIGKHPESRKWNISTPYLKDKKILQIEEEAVASSGGYGTKFNHQTHHIFNPISGKSSNEINSVTVIAKSAMLADALSTTLAVIKKKDRNKFLKDFSEIKVYIS